MGRSDLPQVTVARRGRVALVTIANPPDALMDRETVPELSSALSELEADEAVGAIVLAGGVPGTSSATTRSASSRVSREPSRTVR
jgi:enoyl-CoA hydratase/carnithine racemase